MPVDGLTVVAQLVNFLLLVAILKKWLYGPVMAAMARREAHIAEALADAARREAAAAAAEAAWAAGQAAREAEARARLAALDREAAERGRALAAEAEARARRLEARWRRLVRARRAAIARDVAERAQAETLAAVRAVLADLADATLEDRLVAAFLARLAALPPVERARLRQAAGTVAVASATPLAPADRDALAAALRELGLPEPAFTLDPALVAGIELAVGPWRVGWHVAGHLDALARRAEAAMTEALDAQAA